MATQPPREPMAVRPTSSTSPRPCAAGRRRHKPQPRPWPPLGRFFARGGRSRPIALTFLVRLTAPLRSAPPRLARSPSASSSAAITAASAAASTAGSTRPARCVLTSWRGSIPTVAGTAPATAATAPFASGSTCARAGTTATARLVGGLPSSPSRRQRRPSVPRTSASAALPRASRAPGTGAPSEPNLTTPTALYPRVGVDAGFAPHRPPYLRLRDGHPSLLCCPFA